ncbi:MAG: hypothetical protein WD512_06720 [Candidatus Paceibacterota bacterium]
MKKKEVIELYKKSKTTIPFKMIFDMYEEEEEIPDEVLKYLLTPSYTNRQISWYTGLKGFLFVNEKFKKLI